MTERIDAVVVGSGPNGLAAAITLARTGRRVQVLEAAGGAGGGTRSAELTLPGFVHDVCSAIHPFGRASPFFASAGLERHGLAWIDPPVELAHPLDDGSVAVVTRDVGATAASLGVDAAAYRRFMAPLAREWHDLLPDVLAPLHIPLEPRRLLRLARFGIFAIQPATLLARRFRGRQARALLAGCAAHSFLPLGTPVSGAIGLTLLVSAHALGWPFPRGGAQQIAVALADELRAHGGEVLTGRPIRVMADLPPHGVALFDVTPRQLLGIAGDRLGGLYAMQLRRFRYGPGVFKLDLAIEGEIPWRSAEVARAGTVHLGGTFEEIAASEAEVHRGRVPGRPFVLLAQQSVFDRSRAPEGRNAVWAYCHVPNGSGADMTEPILRQIERFAPGFRDRILAIHASGPAQMQAHDENFIGGDINGGIEDLRQLFTRPAVRLDPYSTPDPRIWICSSSTPPGPGVHGMCGYHAARSVLRRGLR